MALLPGERTDLVSTNRLGHGWAYKKLTNQQGCKDGCGKDGCDLACDWLPAQELQPICRDQCGALDSMIKKAPYYLPSQGYSYITSVIQEKSSSSDRYSKINEKMKSKEKSTGK